MAADNITVHATGAHALGHVRNRMVKLILFLTGLLCLAGCGETVASRSDARVLLIGDSMLASNRAVGGSVADAIEAAIAVEVVDRSIPGASYFHALPISGAAGFRIPKQSQPGPWDVVVVNGGGNDLVLGCGCGDCSNVLNRLIAPDGRSGAIPSFVQELKGSAAHVVYVGYLRNPGTATPVKACGPSGNELDRRLAMLDQLDPAMTFLAMSDLVPHGSLSYHQIDRIHPSRMGSREIGLRIARLIGPMLGRPPDTYVPAGLTRTPEAAN